MDGHGISELLDDLDLTNPSGAVDGEAFSGVLIDHGEDTDLAAICISDEVKIITPHMVWMGGS